MTTLLAIVAICLAVALIITYGKHRQLVHQVHKYSEHTLALQGEIDTHLAAIKEKDHQLHDLNTLYDTMVKKEEQRKAQWAEARKKRHQNQNKEEKK